MRVIIAGRWRPTWGEATIQALPAKGGGSRRGGPKAIRAAEECHQRTVLRFASQPSASSVCRGRVLSVSLTDFLRRRLVSLATQRKGVAVARRKSGKSESVQVEKARKKFVAWRRSRKARSRIPEELWTSAVVAARDIGVNQAVQGATTGLLRAETTSCGFAGDAICESEWQFCRVRLGGTRHVC